MVCDRISDMARRVVAKIRDNDGVCRGRGKAKRSGEAQVRAAWAYVSWLREFNELCLEWVESMEARRETRRRINRAMREALDK